MSSSLPNIHPFLVHFPIALFTTALLCDAAVLLGYRHGWLDRSAVLLYAGAAITSGAAALSGKLAADALGAYGDGVSLSSPRVLEAVALHGDWAFFAVVLLFVIAALRFEAMWRDRKLAAPSVHRVRLLAFALALLAQGVVVYTAGRGGELVYRFGVGRSSVGPNGDEVQDRAIIPGRR